MTQQRLRPHPQSRCGCESRVRWPRAPQCTGSVGNWNYDLSDDDDACSSRMQTLMNTAALTYLKASSVSKRPVMGPPAEGPQQCSGAGLSRACSAGTFRPPVVPVVLQSATDRAILADFNDRRRFTVMLPASCPMYGEAQTACTDSSPSCRSWCAVRQAADATSCALWCTSGRGV